MALVECGGRVVQETRLYNPDAGETAGMSSKEHAHDYRYFPEPDLLPLRVGEEWLDGFARPCRSCPRSKRARFIGEYGLREYDAEVLTATRAIAEYFETAAAVSGDPKTAANWVMGDLMGLLKAEGKEIADSPVSARHLGELVALVAKGEISGKLAKDIFAKMFASGEAAGRHHRARGAEADQRCRRARADDRGCDREQSQAGGAVQGRQDHGDELPGGPGDARHARPGQCGGGDRDVQAEAGVILC